MLKLFALFLLLACSTCVRGGSGSSGLGFDSKSQHGAAFLRQHLLQQQQQQQHVPSQNAALASPPAHYSGSAVLASYASLGGSGAGLMSRLPAVHGRVNKSGAAERLSWSQAPHYAIAREAIFLDWRQQELASPAPALAPGQNVTCAAARHPPVPFHHCHVFVNHAYRVAYVRSPKSASTSIMHWLGQCRYNKTRNWNATTCMDYTWERYESPEAVAAIWRDYFFFGFVRNPWARAYSLYKDMAGTNHFLHKHGPRCSMDWGSFCAAPFADFDRLYGSGCSHKPPHYAYWHMMDQYHCMLAPDGGWAVDFLGRVEAGNEDWRVVVDEMNARRLPGVPAVPYSQLEHVHKVEPRQRPPGSSSSTTMQQHQQQQQPLHLQQSQQQRRRRGRRRQLLGMGDAAMVGRAAGRPDQQQQPQLSRVVRDEADDADAVAAVLLDTEEQQLGAEHKMVRVFKHLWRRIRSAALMSSTAGVQQRQQAASADGPYSGVNEHCIDAVSQWFGCDIERFGYLPPLPPAAVGDMPQAEPDGGGPDLSDQSEPPVHVMPWPARS